MAARIEPLMTVDDLDAMPEDGNRYEVIEGELFVSRAPGVPHQRVTKNAIFVFESYLIENPIGEIIPTPGLIFGRYSGVIPDLVFYTHERAKEILSDERLTAAPELVIEILSHGRENVSRDRVVKRQLYGKYRVPEYWILDADSRAVEVYRLRNEVLDLVAIFREGDEITTPLLPGFKCAVASLFR
jgi:Uma2 family endonuclease